MTSRNSHMTRTREHPLWQALACAALVIVLALGSLGAAGCSIPGSAGTNPTALSTEEASSDIPSAASVSAEEFLARIPAYTGSVYTVLNDNEPSFTAADATTDAFETYAPLDKLGRCGSAYACLGVELMPTEERESISEVRPTGWHSSHYDFVDGESLYNRSHLIAFQLAGENANERNLITGTRYLNADGMRPFEEMVGDYIRQTRNHVLYRVTPVFAGNELVARGVQMEARSMEDGGAGISLNVYVYNVQPGVGIDYATGDNWELDESEVALLGVGDAEAPAVKNTEARSTAAAEPHDYVLNTNSHKFHDPSCDAVETIGANNRADVHESRDNLIAAGYAPCGACNP